MQPSLYLYCEGYVIIFGYLCGARYQFTYQLYIFVMKVVKIGNPNLEDP